MVLLLLGECGMYCDKGFVVVFVVVVPSGVLLLDGGVSSWLYSWVLLP